MWEDVLTVGIVTSALSDRVAVLHILPSAPSRSADQQMEMSERTNSTETSRETDKERDLRLRYLSPDLFWELEYLEQDLPSQAQYGSLARQQSAQASPYTSQRWRARWVTPRTDPTYSCCY